MKAKAIVVLASAGLVSMAQAGLTINPTYQGNFNNNTQWQLTAGLAINAWQSAMSDNIVNYTVNITFTDANLSTEGANIIARMRDNTQMAANNPTTGTKLPTGGTLELDSRKTFYMDQDIADNLDGFVMSGSYGNNPVLLANSKYDGYTILLHEIGHILGYSGTTGTWNDGKPFTAYTDFANNITGGNFRFDYLTVGAEGSINGPRTQWATDTFHMTAAADNQRNMSPFFNFGERKGLTALDFESIDDAFHLRPVPAPATAALLGLGGLYAARRRRSRNG